MSLTTVFIFWGIGIIIILYPYRKLIKLSFKVFIQALTIYFLSLKVKDKALRKLIQTCAWYLLRQVFIWKNKS